MPDTLIKYPVIIEPIAYSNTYKAYCPDFDDTDAEATTMEEALEMVTSLITYQVGMLLLKDRNAELPDPTSMYELKAKDLNGKGRCFGWAEVNPFAIKMQIHTEELKAETARINQQGLQDTAKNIEQTAFLGTWLMGMSLLRRNS